MIIRPGVKPFKCAHCDKAFTQRCSLESHERKLHGIESRFAYKQRRDKTYVCEECGNATYSPELHYQHLKLFHPDSPALKRTHDRRLFKFPSSVKLEEGMINTFGRSESCHDASDVKSCGSSVGYMDESSRASVASV